MLSLNNLLCLILFFCGFLSALSLNPVESVLFLILTFCLAGAFLFLNKIEFMALMYIVVYVGAVAVLFLFIIMMLNIKRADTWLDRIFSNNISINILSVTFSLIFLYSVVELLKIYIKFKSNFIVEKMNANLKLFDNLSNIDIFGQILYNYYNIYFLICGLILLVALLGAILITLDFKRHN